MQKNTPIRKMAQASLALLISASHVVGAMDGDVLDLTGAGKGGASGQLRDHDYYKAELQKLEASTRRIHEEVDRIQDEFRKYIKEYYLRTRGVETVIAIPIPEEIQGQDGQEYFISLLNLNTKEDQLGLTEEEELLFAQQESLQTAVKEGAAGPRKIDGWEFGEIENDGNCLYGAVIDQMKRIDHSFLKEVPSDTLPRDSLKLRIEGENFVDKKWTGGGHFKEFVKKFDDVILAVMDTRSPKDGYICYYLGDDKEVITHVPDMGPVPGGKSIIKIATTGTHYMPVIKEPSEGFRKIEIGEVVTEKPQSLELISTGDLMGKEPMEDKEEAQKQEELRKKLEEEGARMKEQTEREEREQAEKEEARKLAEKKEREEQKERTERERVEKEAQQQRVEGLLKWAGMDLQATDNITAAAHYLDINKIGNIKELEPQDVQKELEAIIKFQAWGINNEPTINHIKNLKDIVSKHPGLQKDVQTLVAKYISLRDLPPRSTSLINSSNTDAVSYYINLNKIETLVGLKEEAIGKELEVIVKFQKWGINKPKNEHITLLKDVISKSPSLGEGMQKAVAMYINNNMAIPAVVVKVAKLERNGFMPNVCDFSYTNLLPAPDKHKDEYKESLEEKIKKAILDSKVEIRNGNFIVFDTMKQYEHGSVWTTYETDLGKISQYK